MKEAGIGLAPVFRASTRENTATLVVFTEDLSYQPEAGLLAPLICQNRLVAVAISCGTPCVVALLIGQIHVSVY